MHRYHKIANSLLKLPAVQSLLAVIILGVGWWAWSNTVWSRDFDGRSLGVWVGILLGIALSFAVVFGGAGYFIAAKAFRDSAKRFHAINHLYRNKLAESFESSTHDPLKSSLEPELRLKTLLELEQQTLHQVCEQIALIFNRITRRACTVTVKLVAEEAGELVCFTWARGPSDVMRDSGGFDKFRVAENTGFEAASKIRRGYSLPAAFCGADLPEMERRGEYANTRDGWKRFYKSAIVVPIRHVLNEKSQNLLGFLCVDCRSRNRLGSEWQVEILAAFADQMYNFLSIMRQKYQVINPVI